MPALGVARRRAVLGRRVGLRSLRSTTLYNTYYVVLPAKATVCPGVSASRCRKRADDSPPETLPAVGWSVRGDSMRATCAAGCWLERSWRQYARNVRDGPG